MYLDSFDYDAFGYYSSDLINSKCMNFQLAQLIVVPNAAFLILMIKIVLNKPFQEVLNLENYSYLIT